MYFWLLILICDFKRRGGCLPPINEKIKIRFRYILLAQGAVLILQNFHKGYSLCKVIIVQFHCINGGQF